MANQAVAAPTRSEIVHLENSINSQLLMYQSLCRTTMHTADRVSPTTTHHTKAALTNLLHVAVMIRGNYDPSTFPEATRKELAYKTMVAFRAGYDQVTIDNDNVNRNSGAMSSMRDEFQNIHSKLVGWEAALETTITSKTNSLPVYEAQLVKLGGELKTQMAARDDQRDQFEKWSKLNDVTAFMGLTFFTTFVPGLKFGEYARDANHQVHESQKQIEQTQRQINQANQDIRNAKDMIKDCGYLRGLAENVDKHVQEMIKVALECAASLVPIKNIANDLNTRAHELFRKIETLQDSGTAKNAIAACLLDICNVALTNDPAKKTRVIRHIEADVQAVVDELVNNWGPLEKTEDVDALLDDIKTKIGEVVPDPRLEILGAAYAGRDVTCLVRHVVVGQGGTSLRLDRSDPNGFVNALLGGKDPLFGTAKTLTILFQYDGHPMSLLTTWDPVKGDSMPVVIDPPPAVWRPDGAISRPTIPGQLDLISPLSTDGEELGEGATRVLAVGFHRELLNRSQWGTLYDDLEALEPTGQLDHWTGSYDPAPGVVKSRCVFYTRGWGPVWVATALDGQPMSLDFQ
ncbi:hypothetical protein OQA88_7007 [Cercophora sp. LCS_1]